MSGSDQTKRRVRIERNIYRRPTGVLEVGFKDGAGIQRWRTVDGGIRAARALRDELLARRGRGEVVSRDARLRFGAASSSQHGGCSDRRLPVAERPGKLSESALIGLPASVCRPTATMTMLLSFRYTVTIRQSP
jgi:hypothetical protein